MTAYARFRRNLPRDIEEWITALAVLAMGLLWLNYPASFQRPDMAAFVQYASPKIWTSAAIIIGVMSCVGLASYHDAPRIGNIVRSFSGLFRITLFGAFIGRSLAASDEFSIAMGVVFFSALFALDVRNCWNVAADTFNALRGVHRVADFTSFLVR